MEMHKSTTRLAQISPTHTGISPIGLLAPPLPLLMPCHACGPSEVFEHMPLGRGPTGYIIAQMKLQYSILLCTELSCHSNVIIQSGYDAHPWILVG
jgi:hypothetical protein